MQGLEVDRFGNVYVADTGNNRIRKIDIERNVTTVAGTGTFGSDDNAGEIGSPRHLAMDDSDSIYFAPFNGNLRVFRNGQLYTVVVAGAYSGDGFVENFTFAPERLTVNKKTGRLFTCNGGRVFVLDALVP